MVQVPTTALVSPENLTIHWNQTISLISALLICQFVKSCDKRWIVLFFLWFTFTWLCLESHVYTSNLMYRWLINAPCLLYDSFPTHTWQLSAPQSWVESCDDMLVSHIMTDPPLRHGSFQHLRAGLKIAMICWTGHGWWLPAWLRNQDLQGKRKRFGIVCAKSSQDYKN